MRTTSSRAKSLLLIAAAFTVGIIVMLTMLISNADEYVMKSVNGHLYSGGSLIASGNILDRNGVVLSSGEGGKRTYNSSAAVRKATLHAVGDTYGFISTGVLKTYTSELVGYSLLWGVNTSKDGLGSNLTMTVDSAVCAAALDALNGRKGTVGIYNYLTGEVVCMVSAPTYDVKNKPKDIDSDESGKYDGIYLNKLLNGLYVPGSVFKTVTAICAVENIPDIMSRTFTCTGSVSTGDGGKVICSDVHGKIGFERAFNRSCNCAFAEIALELGNSKLEATFKALGLSKTYTIERVMTAAGSMELASATKSELGWAGIGQNKTMANPLSMMIMMGAIANGGTAVKPYYVENVKGAAGVSTYKAPQGDSLGNYMSKTTADTMKGLLRSTVTDYYGESLFSNMKICAKTGTAEVGGDKSPHAWFAGFSQDTSFPYAFVVVVENAGGGYANAAPVASAALKAIK